MGNHGSPAGRIVILRAVVCAPGAANPNFDDQMRSIASTWDKEYSLDLSEGIAALQGTKLNPIGKMVIKDLRSLLH